MMSSISAGTTTTTALVSTGDTAGTLVFKTNGTTTALTLDTAQDATFAGELKAVSYNETYAAVTSSSGALTINCEAGNVFSLSLSENVTSSTFSNPPPSNTAYAFALRVVQDSTDRTITWPASVDWAAATAPTLSSGSGAVDWFVFSTVDNGTTWYGFTSGQALG